MEGKKIRIGHRSVSRLLHVSVGLLLGLSLMWTPKPLLVLARSYYNVSGSNLYKLAYPAGALTSAQADTILAELEQIGWLDEKSLRKIFAQHLSKQGIQLDYISTIEVGALRRTIDCTECPSTHNRKCVQSPFHGGKCECVCYERLPNERQAGLRIAVLLLADPADRELALQSLAQAGQPCVVPPAGMVAWYPLDEQAGATAVADIAPPPGSTVSDTGVPKPAPVGPIGTGPTPVAGKVGAGALYFYGPFVEVPHSADLTFPGDFSIDAWIRVVPCGGGILAPIVDKWNPATQTGFSLFVDQPSPSTGFLKFQFNNLLFTSLTSLPTGANPLANTGPWVHVAVTVNRATGIGTFYINGAQAGSFALPTGSITNTLPMLIGGIRVPGGRCEIAIDELELFTRALDQQEIQGIVAADSAGKCRPQPIERGQICVLKFEDLDGDGVQDANEPLLPGWQFTVTDANNNPVGTITTSPPGTPLACLPVTAPGTYTVTEQVQSGWMPTTPTSQTVTVQPGQTVNVAFGNKRPCDLQISKSFSPNPVPTGQPVTITLTITNVGAGTCPPGPSPGTVVSEPVFPGMPFNLPVTISQSGGNLNWQCGFTAPGDYLNCATTDPLPPGYSATFTFTATITLTPGSQIRNCATVTNQSDTNSQNNVSCATLLITGCVRPPANMTAWWPLDETSGTTANDLALVANNGTHVNGPTPTPGIVAGALRFDGVNDHVRVPDHPELNVGTGNFTLDAWVRTTAAQGVVVLVDKRSGPTPLGYSLFLSNGRLGLQMAHGTGSSTCAPTPTSGVSCVNYVAPTTSPNVADGQWHHVAAVVDRADTTSGVRLYVDGAQVFTGAPLGAPPSGSPATPANLDNTGDLYLGVRTPAQGIGLFFPGDLDEVELIKRALTLQEIQALVQARSEGKCKACIEGMKWNDANGDGVINPGETGLSGWTIQLSGPVSGTTTTATGGTYRFCGLFPGTYTVSEVLQPGWVQTFPPAPGTYTLTLVSGQIAANRNFGNRRVSGLPDLIVRNLRVVPLTIPRGGVAVVSFDIVNQGEGQAGSATHQVRLFIRRPGAADVDVLLGTVSTGTLAAGASQSFNVPIRIPTDVPTGAATIRAIADSGSAVTEANEGNNVAEVQITITGGP